MSIIARVESLWRYPVKSMQGEERDEAFSSAWARGQRAIDIHEGKALDAEALKAFTVAHAATGRTASRAA